MKWITSTAILTPCCVANEIQICGRVEVRFKQGIPFFQTYAAFASQIIITVLQFQLFLANVQMFKISLVRKLCAKWR